MFGVEHTPPPLREARASAFRVRVGLVGDPVQQRFAPGGQEFFGVTVIRFAKDLLRRSWMSGSTAPTHGDAGTTKLMAHCRRRDAQLGTDLAQGPALGVQVGCTLNVHRGT